MNEERKRKTSQELPVNDQNASGDSRVSQHEFLETSPYERYPNSFEESGSEDSQEMEPFECVRKLGSDMKSLFSSWSEEFLKCGEFEAETLKRLDSIKKQAYILEAELLERKLEKVKQIITHS